MKVILSFVNGQAVQIDKCSFLEISTSDKKAIVHNGAEKQVFDNVSGYSVR